MTHTSPFQVKRLATAAAVAALSVSVLVQASFAAELDAAAVPTEQPIVQMNSTGQQQGGSYTNPRIVNRSAAGYLLDDGGPALHFVAADE